MNQAWEALLERGMADSAEQIVRGPAVHEVRARARQQRRRRTLTTALALVVGAGIAGAVPLLGPHGGGGTGPESGHVVLDGLPGRATLVLDRDAEGSLLLCLVRGQGTSCVPARAGAAGAPAVRVEDGAVFGLAGGQYPHVRVAVAGADPRLAQTAAADGMTAFALLTPTVVPDVGTIATVTVTASTRDGVTARTVVDGSDGGLAVTPRSSSSLVTVVEPAETRGRGGVYGWTRDGWACLTTGPARAGRPRVDELALPAWCQRMPEGRTAVSLGWSDAAGESTRLPDSVAVLVPPTTTQVTIAGRQLRLATVDDQTWALDPGDLARTDIAQAPVVVTSRSDGGVETWQGTYADTALRGRMP
ncbi:MAG: hypothetical protein U0Q15_01045 [Kineosporiaceae bacterium]